jgi:hypothetical protein
LDNLLSDCPCRLIYLVAGIMMRIYSEKVLKIENNHSSAKAQYYKRQASPVNHAPFQPSISSRLA